MLKFQTKTCQVGYKLGNEAVVLAWTKLFTKYYFSPSAIVSSYLVYVVCVNFFIFYRVLSCVTFILVYGMSVALPFA